MPAVSKPCVVGFASGILIGVLTGFMVISDAPVRPMTMRVAPGARSPRPAEVRSPSRSQSLPQATTKTPAEEAETAEVALHAADECAQVYLDVGSNIGVQVRKLYEPHYYKHAPVLDVFDDIFGPPHHRSRPSKESGLCAFGFEASPVHVERLTKLQSVYSEQGWRVKFTVPRAVGISNEQTITLNLNAKHNLGASAVWNNEGSRGRGTSVEVKTLDLPSWVESVVRHRAWTAASFRKTKPSVLMKMDIEGSEYLVLPKLLEKGLLCKGIIDMIFIEWHPQYIDNGKNTTRELKRSIQDSSWCGPKGPVTISGIDDESFNRDGRPLPGEPDWMSQQTLAARERQKAHQTHS